MVDSISENAGRTAEYRPDGQPECLFRHCQVRRTLTFVNGRELSC